MSLTWEHRLKEQQTTEFEGPSELLSTSNDNLFDADGKGHNDLNVARSSKAAGALILLALSPFAFALNPSLDVSQYAHKAWLSLDGYFKGTINSMAQTPDGYLWLGTDLGLLRFDGVRFTRFEFPDGQRLPMERIRSLLTARDGTLWIGTDGGLASWKDRRLRTYREFDGHPAMSLMEGRDGRVWAGSYQPAQLCAIHGEQVTCEADIDRFGSAALPLGEDSHGSLWLESATGLWQWTPDKAKLDPAFDFTSFVEGDDREILFGGQSAMRRLAGGKLEKYRIPGVRDDIKVRCMFRDGDGGLWVGTFNQGLWHRHQGKWDHFQRSNGLSGDFIWSVFQDREGSVWVATSDGLDRFRAFAVPAISTLQGLSSGDVYSVLASRDGSVWIATPDGLNRWNDGQVTVYRKRNGLPDDRVFGLLEDRRNRIWIATLGAVYFEGGRFQSLDGLAGELTGQSMAEDADGSIWLGRADGFYRVAPDDTIQRTPWAAFGNNAFPAFSMAPDTRRGGLWLGSTSGLSFFQDGKVRASYTSANGLGAGIVSWLRLETDGVLWASTQGGLSRIKDGRISTLTSKNGLPCDTVHWMVQDDNRFAWLYTACGLLRIARADLDAWAADPKRMVPTTVFDESDGVRSAAATSYNQPMVTRNADGRFWFRTGSGVSILDPRRLEFNNMPPPVHIEKVFADDKEYNLTSGLRLPALTRDLQIEYTALSFVAPEKVRFKFKLEGQDPGWMDEGTERHTHYSNLPPRTYRFRVIASNNSGVWNETGDTLEFSIAPAYYQTNWFRALLAATAIGLMWAAYQFRVRLLQRESRQLREVIDTIPASAWSAKPDGSVEFTNERWLEYGGVSGEKGLGWGWETSIHPEDRERFLAEWREALASGKPMEAEARVLRSDGEYRWLLIRNVPLRDKSGTVVKWYGTSTDIDDFKRAEALLRESETRFRTFIDQATDAFFVLEFDGGKILDVNRRACESLGYTREELIGQSVFLFDANLTPEFLEQNVRPPMEAGQTMTFETRHRRKDGSVFPVEIRARTFQYQGRVVNLSLALDITERKRSEEERERLRQLETELAHINRVSMMGELAASVAHEVNQPLTGIVSNGSACLRFLAGDTPNLEEAREAVRDIVRDGKRAGDVIARIRALTKRTELPKEKLDLNEVVREVLALVGDEAKKNAVIIRTRFADNAYPVLADRVQLQQVLLNLVMNGMEAMSNVSDRQRELLIVTTNIDANQVQVTVEDSGTGLDPSIMSKIFEPFYTTKSGGMGMGLSISRSIIQNHGGRLWATPNDGPGTSFHFTLPRHRGDEGNGGVAGA